LVSTLDDYLTFAKMLLSKGCLDGKQIMGEKTVEFMTFGRLPKAIENDLYTWRDLEGFRYGNLIRTVQEPGLCMYNAPKGAYGWDGWLGCYFLNIPSENACILLFMQRTGAGTNLYTRRLVNSIMGVI
nr:serine hydrolase [Acetatifactor sp.]